MVNIAHKFSGKIVFILKINRIMSTLIRAIKEHIFVCAIGNIVMLHHIIFIEKLVRKFKNQKTMTRMNVQKVNNFLFIYLSIYFLTIETYALVEVFHAELYSIPVKIKMKKKVIKELIIIDYLTLNILNLFGVLRSIPSKPMRADSIGKG